MTDLISRSAVLTVGNVRKVAEYDEAGYDMTYDAVPVEAIEALPSLDVAPVVRCKSCIKRSTFECPMYSEVDGSDYGLGIIVNDRTDDDGYCHCGARMDGEENG